VPLKNFPVCNDPCGGISNWKLTAQFGGLEKLNSRARLDWERSKYRHENGKRKGIVPILKVFEVSHLKIEFTGRDVWLELKILKGKSG
jgi:hypothetical protein